jgi:hypothetical protein
VPSDSPIVRVEFEYADGRIQTLSGPPAEQWLEEINSVVAFTQIRCGQQQISDFPWKWSTKTSPPPPPPRDTFEHYEGMD